MKYNKTLKIGKTVVHIVNPSQITIEEIEQVLKDYHAAGWVIIDELIEKEDPLILIQQKERLNEAKNGEWATN